MKLLAFEKTCCLNIKTMTSKTVLLYPRYVKLDSEIYRLLSVIPSHRNRRFSAVKTSENTKQDFPSFSFLTIMTLGRVNVSCPYGLWENGIPLNKLFTLGGRLSNPSKFSTRQNESTC